MYNIEARLYGGAQTSKQIINMQIRHVPETSILLFLVVILFLKNVFIIFFLIRIVISFNVFPVIILN